MDKDKDQPNSVDKKIDRPIKKPLVPDELASDGSGGAFAGTEEVIKEDTDDKPLPPDHETPY